MKDKAYYTPQEVSQDLDIETYVLRYWETQFPFLKPARTEVGWRRYRREDISKIVLIKKLLYDEHFTIEGARQRLKELSKDGQLDLKATFEKTRKESIFEEIAEIREALEEILEILEGTQN